MAFCFVASIQPGGGEGQMKMDSCETVFQHQHVKKEKFKPAMSVMKLVEYESSVDLTGQKGYKTEHSAFSAVDEYMTAPQVLEFKK
jgi:hypothetical protein